MRAPGTSIERRKQRVALISVLAAMGIFIFKLLVGLHTNSMGILSAAADSALDVLVTLLTWFSLRIAALPADANHPFGHGKFENFSALLETGLLVLTALAIAGIAIGNWMSGQIPRVHIDAWAFAAMVVSIGVDWSRSRIMRRAAIVLRSDALAADALNFTNDMASSTAVLIGLGLVWLAKARQVAWLLHADTASALAVAAAIAWLALRLGRRTAGVLLDEAPAGIANDVSTALQGIRGLAALDRLRLRKVGSRYFVDAQVELEPATTLEHAGVVKQQAAERIRARLPEADVVIETNPRRPALFGPFEHIQEIAQRQNRTIHDLSVYKVGAGLEVEFHLELDAALPLAAAHEVVSRLESEMRSEIPSIQGIVTHIEPEADRVATAAVLQPERLSARVQQIASQAPGVLDCHNLQWWHSGGHLVLSCHCSFDDAMPVAEVHELVTRLETEIKRQLPEIFRVTIHPEPRSDNRR